MQIFVLKNWNTSLGMLLRHFKGVFLWFFGLRKGESTNPTLQMTQTKIYFLLKLSNFSGLKFINPSWFDPSPLSVFCVGRARGSLRWRREAQAVAAWLAAGDPLLALVLTHNPLSPESWALGSFESLWCSFHEHMANSHAGPILEGHMQSFKPVGIRWCNLSL